MKLNELKDILDKECSQRKYDPENLDFKRASTLVDFLKKHVWEKA